MSQTFLLTHTGHDHNPQIEEEEETGKISEGKTNNKFLHKNNELLNDSQTSTKQYTNTVSDVSFSTSDLIPQPTEFIFLWLLVSPLLLYTIRNKKHNRECN